MPTRMIGDILKTGDSMETLIMKLPVLARRSKEIKCQSGAIVFAALFASRAITRMGLYMQ